MTAQMRLSAKANVRKVTMTYKLFNNARGQKTVKAGFPLFRYFQLASIPAIVIILIVAGLGLRSILRKYVLFEAERDAIRISRGIRDCEMRRFFELNHGMEQSLVIPQEELLELDHQMRTFLTPFDIVKIKVYNTETKIVYSTDSAIIGRLDPDNAKLAEALGGSVVSKHESKEAIWDLADEERADVEIVETYVPILGSDGCIIGSFEVYKDVTKDIATADSTLIRAGSVLTITVLSVFSILMFVIHRVQKRKVELAAQVKSAEQLKSINQQLLSEITERKKAEEALQKTTKELQVILDSVPAGIWYKDTENRLLRVNKAGAESIGMKVEDVEGRSVSDIFPEDAEHYYEDDLEVIKSGKPKLGIVERLQVPGGENKWVQTDKVPYRDEQGNVAGVIAFVQDITERKQAEQVLHESEERYRRVVQDQTEFIVRWQPDGVRTFVNDSYCRYFGISRDEAIGTSFFPLITEDYHEAVRKRIESATPENPTSTGEHQVTRPDGTIGWNQWTDRATFDESGQLIEFQSVGRDITERKKAEKVLERVNEDLESSVRELNRSNKELQDFAQVTAHDLKSPLRAIGALAHWISTDYADKFDEDGREQMELLTDRVKRMHNLIEAILQYSRVGHEKERHVQVNLNELVPEVIDMVAPPRNIAITIENHLPVIECEETRIMQVFQNLLSNAVKYLDKPQGQIRIGCVEEDGFWKFSVADNGPGIEEKYFKKIFEIFQTLSPRDQVANTGIGLSIVKKIVKVYGGSVWVESKPGEGSTFIFTLPKQQEETTDAKLKANIAC
jgi:PAS domain S-box-containing protein